MTNEPATNHAAIDIGTNSFHLLVARVGADGDFEVLTTEKETVRLGQDAGEIRLLADDAMDRGVAALHRFRAIADSFGAEIEAVATSAVREAENGPDFVARVAAEAGIEIDVIPGVEEARLIHLGVLQALPLFEQQVLVVDIGGGSTEFVIGKSGRVLGARSVKLGHLRLTSRFFPGGIVEPGSIDECRAFVRSYLVPMLGAMVPLGHQVAVGSSGTATAIGDILRFKREGDTGNPGLDTVITEPELGLLIDELGRFRTPRERGDNVDALSQRRADVIVAGAILLHEIMIGFGSDRMVTSPYALREGVLLDRTLGVESTTERLSDLRRDSLERMADAFEEDRQHVEHATNLSLELFDGLRELHGLAGNERALLRAAGLLHNVGLFISHGSHHHHSYYIIRNSDRLTGYTEREIAIVALVARYHRRSGPKSSHEAFVELSDADQRVVRWLAGMLRIGIALDRTRAALVASVTATFDVEQITIATQIVEGHDPTVELFQANSRSELLAKTASRLVFFT